MCGQKCQVVPDVQILTKPDDDWGIVHYHVLCLAGLANPIFGLLVTNSRFLALL